MTASDLPAPECCAHGIPTFCACRWCTEGGEPGPHHPDSPRPRDEALAARLRTEWAAAADTVPARRRRRTR